MPNADARVGLPVGSRQYHIAIRVRPTHGYGKPTTEYSMGSNHIRYSGGVDTLRVTTDAALSYIAHETPFALIKPVTLILGPDEPFGAAVDTSSREFLERTRDYWLDWVRSLAIPLDSGLQSPYLMAFPVCLACRDAVKTAETIDAGSPIR